MLQDTGSGGPGDIFKRKLGGQVQSVSTPHFRTDTKRTSAGKLSPFALEYS